MRPEAQAPAPDTRGPLPWRVTDAVCLGGGRIPFAEGPGRAGSLGLGGEAAESGQDADSGVGGTVQSETQAPLVLRLRGHRWPWRRA